MHKQLQHTRHPLGLYLFLRKGTVRSADLLDRLVLLQRIVHATY